MFTVSLKVTKISFTSFVLVLLFGSVHHQAHSLFYQPKPPTWGQRIGWESPDLTLMQKMGVVKTPKTLTQGLADTLITPHTVLAAGGLITSYMLVSVWSKYNELKERYKDILLLFKNNLLQVNELIASPGSSKYQFTDRIAFNKALIQLINVINNQTRESNINLKDFQTNLTKDIASFPYLTYFLPATLTAGISKLKQELTTVLSYTQKFNLAKIQQDLAEFDYRTLQQGYLQQGQHQQNFQQQPLYQPSGAYQAQIPYNQPQYIQYNQQPVQSGQMMVQPSPTAYSGQTGYGSVSQTQQQFEYPSTSPMRSQPEQPSRSLSQEPSSAPAQETQTWTDWAKSNAARWYFSSPTKKNNAAQGVQAVD